MYVGTDGWIIGWMDGCISAYSVDVICLCKYASLTALFTADCDNLCRRFEIYANYGWWMDCFTVTENG